MEKNLIFKEKKEKHIKIIRFMKCCLIFIILGMGSCFANETYSQRTFFTFEYNNRTVKEIIHEIELSSEYIFFYLDKSVDLNRKVSVKVENEPIEKVLDQFFTGTRNQYYISDRQIVISSRKNDELPYLAPILLQQLRTITGVVHDESGPVTGATVVVKGTTNGAFTDLNGQFTISNVQPDAILQVSYIGYKSQELPVGNQTHLEITIQEDVETLEEVVVVGYGTHRKETLTGAIASITSKDLSISKTNNVVANMQGKLPGMLYRPNSGEVGDFSMSLSIRGFGTPVIVIDGVVRNYSPYVSGNYEGYQGAGSELAQINTEDIESITLLKDASAAIYGMNAANGVLIVTTKKGKNERVRFSYSGLTGFKTPTGLPKTMDAYNYRLIANEMARNMGLPDVYNQETLDNYRRNEYPYMDYDWIDLYMRKWTPPINSHTLSARGGTDKLNFFTSVGYSDDKGPVASDIQYYRRFTVRSNITAELTKSLKMNFGISGRMDQSQLTSDSGFELVKVLLITDRGIGPLTSSGKYSAMGQEDKNPEAKFSLGEGYRRQYNTNIQTQLDFTYSPPFLPGLDINLLGAYDTRTQNWSQLTRQLDLYNYFSDTFSKTQGQDRYTNRIDLYNKYYVKLQANYSFNYEGHSIALMAAAEASQDRLENLNGQRLFDAIYTNDVILSSGSTNGQSTGGSLEFRRLAALLGRVNYDYHGKYLLEGMIRRDGSYRYAPSKRWVLFPSVSAGWRVSEEGFFKNNVSFISNLKLRTSYGVSGRDQGNAYEYVAAYSRDTNRNYIFNEGDVTVGMSAPGVVNDYLTWVTSKIFNVAFDAGFFKNKLNFTLEFFRRKNTGLLASRVSSVPNTFGASFPQENLNSDMNLGFDVELTYRDQIGDFRYSIGANITYARTKRLYVERAPFTSQWDRWRNGNQDRYTGRQLIYKYDGQYTSLQQLETAPLHGGARGNSMMLPGGYRLVDVNGDGRISGEDQLYLNWTYGDLAYNTGSSGEWDGSQVAGRVNPPLQYGFPIEVSYQSFDFNMLLGGASLFSLVIHPGDVWGYGRYPTMNDHFYDRSRPVDPNADRWDPATEWIIGKYMPLRTETTGTTENNMTSVWNPNVTYLRLRNVELGYTIPKNVIRKIGLDNARFYVNGSNLLTFAPKLIRMYDPEKHEGSYNVGLTLPLMKAVNMGVSLTF